MNINDIMAALDEEIRRLQQVRYALAGLEGTKATGREPSKKGPGRPKGSTNKTVAPVEARRGIMSPKSRERIAAAQRERWARLQAPKRKVSKKAGSKPDSSAKKIALPKKSLTKHGGKRGAPA